VLGARHKRVPEFEDEVATMHSAEASSAEHFGETASTWIQRPARYQSPTPRHQPGMIGSKFQSQVTSRGAKYLTPCISFLQWRFFCIVDEAQQSIRGSLFIPIVAM
jgi:hypothetical protein